MRDGWQMSGEALGVLRFALGESDGNAKRLTPNAGSYWFLGFDCAHEGDRCPTDVVPREGEVYRDLEWVLDRLRTMAEACREVPE
jgi:hypothetical protein